MLKEAGNKSVGPLRMIFPADGGWWRDYRVGGSGGGCLLAATGVGRTGCRNVAAFFFGMSEGWRLDRRQHASVVGEREFFRFATCNTYLYLISTWWIWDGIWVTMI